MKLSGMKLSGTGMIALLSLISTAFAVQSKSFYLVLKTDDASLKGHTLSACHEGAAYEGLCKASKIPKADKDYQTYQFNYTKSSPNIGILTWELIGGNFVLSSGMNLYVDPSTNMGLAQFTPSDTFQYVGFDSDNRMYIRSYLDDTTNPPTGNSRKRLYRWYMCQSYYTGYQYNQLNWLYGEGPPQNPSCKKVGVERVFVR